MKTASRIIVVAVVMAMACVGGVSAQDAVQEPERRCTPTGTWIGQNEVLGLEYMVSVEPMGGGRYSIVAEGIDDTPPWEVSTPWRGVLRKSGHRTFSFAQIKFMGPSLYTDPGEGVPDIIGIWGEMTMFGCDHAEVVIEPGAVYAWGQIPFEDEPVATTLPAIEYFTRVPFDNAFQYQSE